MRRVGKFWNVSEGGGCEDEIGKAMVDEINWRLGVLLKSVWAEVGLLEVLGDVLGELYAMFRLLWEWQRRAGRRVRMGGIFREARMLRMEDWRELDVRVGYMFCASGFCVFRSVARAPRRPMAVGAGEVEVVLELEGRSLRKLVRRGVRGYQCSTFEGLLPPFALLRVRGVLREPTRAVVKLVEVVPRGHSRRGAGSAWPPAGLRSLGTGEAESWFRKAVSVVKPGEAARCAEQAAMLGHVEAMCWLGERHGRGEGLPVDRKAAVAWYRKAAELGNAMAMCELGVSYRDGVGVPINARAAVAWYRNAAELGSAKAMLSLGVAFTEGKGVGVDNRAAVSWFLGRSLWAGPLMRCTI
jgi:hypothetical protein